MQDAAIQMMTTKRAMLAHLNLSQWTPRKFDAAATEEVAQNHAAAPDAGRYTKSLIATRRAHNAYTDLRATLSEIRTLHYANTLPWQDAGARILPVDNFTRYTGLHRNLVTRFDAQLPTFVSDYPSLRDAQKSVLNSLWRAEDYPDPSEIGARFSVKLDFSPLPDSGDFRVALTQAEIDFISAQQDAKVQTAMQNAQADAVARLFTVVEHACEVLAQPKGIFRDTLVTNMRDVCEVLKSLNIAQDPKLEAMRARVDALATYEPETLRNSHGSRAAAAAEAARIVAEMESIYGPVVKQ